LGQRLRRRRQLWNQHPSSVSLGRRWPGRGSTVTDPNGNVTTYVYDDFGQMLRQTSPVSGVTTYQSDEAGNLIWTTDTNGAATTRAYDALGRVTIATSTHGGDSETISWSYDTTPPATKPSSLRRVTTTALSPK